MLKMTCLLDYIYYTKKNINIYNYNKYFLRKQLKIINKLTKKNKFIINIIYITYFNYISFSISGISKKSEKSLFAKMTSCFNN